jgi:hypothetical protein
MNTTQRFTSFAEFYPYYLSEHSNRVCRVLHYLGTSLGFIILLYALLIANYLLLPVGLVCGYAFAWVGHFFFEKNRPATFQYPLWSFLGDWVMLKDLLLGRLNKVHPGLNGDIQADRSQD